MRDICLSSESRKCAGNVGTGSLTVNSQSSGERLKIPKLVHIIGEETIVEQWKQKSGDLRRDGTNVRVMIE